MPQKKERISLSVSREIKGWLSQNAWFNSSYEFEKMIREEIRKEGA